MKSLKDYIKTGFIMLSLLLLIFLVSCQENMQVEVNESTDESGFSDKVQLNLDSEWVKETGMKHATITFESLDDIKLSTFLPEWGLTLWSYSKEMNYIWVSIPVENINKLSELDNVVSINDVNPYDKIHIDFKHLPTHVQNDDGTLNLEVRCYEDVDLEFLFKVLEKFSTNLTLVPTSHIKLFKIENSSIIEIASEEVVSSIHEGGNIPLTNFDS